MGKNTEHSDMPYVLATILQTWHHLNRFIGVRDLVARGYFIPGGASQRGGGQAPMFPCRTLSDLDYPGLRSVTCDVSSRWVLTTVQ